MLDELYQSFSPVAFTIGEFSVTWYGLGYILSFLLAAVLAYRICRRWEIPFSFDSLLTLLIACILGILIGGRLGYVLFYNLEYYLANPAKILAVNEGGMSFHGGLVGFAIGVIITSRLIRMPIATLGDISGICVPVGLGIVRCTNFINGELWGSVTDMPWGVVFDGAGPLPRHPTQLYEAFLEGLVLLIVLYLLARRKPPLYRGTYFGLFSIGYALFRIAVEFIRQPDYQVGYLFGTSWITMGMILSLPMVFVGIGFLAYARHYKYPQAGEERLLVVVTNEDDCESVEPGDEQPKITAPRDLKLTSRETRVATPGRSGSRPVPAKPVQARSSKIMPEQVKSTQGKPTRGKTTQSRPSAKITPRKQNNTQLNDSSVDEKPAKAPKHKK